MPEISYIKKKVGPSYLVWFENSNTYFQLEEPAWFIFTKIRKRYKSDTIAREFAIRYGSTPEASHTFVTDIRAEIKKMNQPDNVQTKTGQFPVELNEHTFDPWSIRHYNFGDKEIIFSYESRLLEHYLHPLISHFETSEQGSGYPHFELFALNGQIVFRFNGEVKGMWTNVESHLVKGMIFMYLINVMHNRADADWLMTVHASAITNGKKTILFSAAPGSGKTTIAALLQARGYRLISDDFVPVDRLTLCAWPFPIAMSVKEGSMELLAPILPGLAQKDLNFISPEKRVRYLAPSNFRDVMKEIHPVRKFIFVHYDTSVDFRLVKLDHINAIKQLLQQAWIAPVPGNPSILLERLSHISFYELTYSDNQKALDSITNLFDHDQ